MPRCSIDTAAARAVPGVVAVLTGRDYVDDGFVGMPHFPNPAGAIDIKVPSFTPTPECEILDEPQLPFAVDLVRFVGEAVAVVIAESLPAARDAAEAVRSSTRRCPPSPTCSRRSRPARR